MLDGSFRLFGMREERMEIPVIMGFSAPEMFSRTRTEIGNELARSPKTVDGHQERLMKKLRIFTRAELMRFAIREGLAQA